MIELEKKVDARGYLVELFRDEFEPGQVYIFSLEPHVKRGGHWHERKREVFVLLSGRLALILEDLETGQRQVLQFDDEVNAGPLKVDIPPGVLHTVVNNFTRPGLVAAWISEKFNPADPDTFYPERK